MEAKGLNVEPSNEAVLILHRQGFNGCYKPVGLTCSTNGGKVGYDNWNLVTLIRDRVWTYDILWPPT